jgi:hypothetical protein
MNDLDDFFEVSTIPSIPSNPETEELQIGDRVRLNENFNNMKATCLLEVVDILKSGKIKVRMVYDHSIHILERSQIETY